MIKISMQFFGGRTSSSGMSGGGGQQAAGPAGFDEITQRKINGFVKLLGYKEGELYKVVNDLQEIARDYQRSGEETDDRGDFMEANTVNRLANKFIDGTITVREVYAARQYLNG